MQLIWITTLAVAGLTAAATVPRADSKGPCDCPTFGPVGTCTLTRNPFLASNEVDSAVCGTNGFNYVCPGTYDNPNCNACAQSLLGNIPEPGRMQQCDGSKWCSKDNGVSFDICAADEKPFVPAYSTSIEFSTDSTAAVVASDTTDLTWLHNTIPQWLDKICYATSCEASPSSPPSADFAYPAPGSGLGKGTLTLGVSEAQFDKYNPTERDIMINLASLAIIRATTCETLSYQDLCLKSSNDCGLKHIKVCKAPSDMNIQMMSFDEQGHESLHAQLHVQLKWDDKSTPFDCSTLDLPFDLAAKAPGLSETELGTIEKVSGVLTMACNGLVKLFSHDGK